MVKKQFIDCKFIKVNLDRLNVINSIIDEYLADGYKLTLRQLHYQLVSRDLVNNTPQEYSKLSKLLTNGRMAGLVDWDAIEDRVRVPNIPWCAESASSAVERVAKYSFRLNRQSEQKKYVEVWSEKDALSGILSRVTEEYHINLVINRGYSSCSAMERAYSRLFRNIYTEEKECVILYLGDHDPSGLDMVRDIRSRLHEFDRYEILPGKFEVKHIALTTEQVYKYQPPENFAKLKDPRAKGYVEKFGDKSWECDALNPQTLTALLKTEIESLIDVNLYQSVVSKEGSMIQKLLETSKELRTKGY
jgi:hypothetical protein